MGSRDLECLPKAKSFDFRHMLFRPQISKLGNKPKSEVSQLLAHSISYSTRVSIRSVTETKARYINRTIKQPIEELAVSCFPAISIHQIASIRPVSLASIN